MKQRTVNIILCCKGHGKGKDYKERIANYMSKECACPVDAYNNETIYQLLRETARDYVQSNDDAAREFANKFIEFSDTYFKHIGAGEIISDLYATIFHMTRVRRVVGETDGLGRNVYANGFTEEQIKLGEEILSNLE